MNDFVFSSSFNLANMTCQLVELGSINPLKPISTSWNIEIAKLKLLSLRLGCFLASLQYPNIDPNLTLFGTGWEINLETLKNPLGFLKKLVDL